MLEIDQYNFAYPLDWAFIGTNGAAAGLDSQVQITGWDWWQVISYAETFANVGGAAAARFALQVSVSNGLLMEWFAPGITAIGNTENMFLSDACLGVIVAGVAQNIALGRIPIVGDGTITATRNGGDAFTRHGGASIVINGVKSRNVRRR